MEYCGGTYISQVEERSADEALQAWARTLDLAPIFKFDEQNKLELIACVQDEHHDLVPLDGLVNSWCTSALTSGGSALVNIIATVPSTNT